MAAASLLSVMSRDTDKCSIWEASLRGGTVPKPGLRFTKFLRNISEYPTCGPWCGELPKSKCCFGSLEFWWTRYRFSLATIKWISWTVRGLEMNSSTPIFLASSLNVRISASDRAVRITEYA